LPDLGHKQAIAMPHVSQEQRNKPELDFIWATKSVYIKHGVISTLISLSTSRITEGKKRIEKETSRTRTTDTVLDEINWREKKTLNLWRSQLRRIEQLQTALPALLITNQTDFIAVRLLQKILLRINRGLTLSFEVTITSESLKEKIVIGYHYGDQCLL